MAVKLISVKCPECGATLNIEEGREQAFCTYCGTKVLLHNENEHIYRHIDEASIKQTEAEAMLRMKELEIEEKENERSRKGRKIAYILAAVLVVIGIAILPLGGFSGMYAILAGALIAEFTFIGNSNKKKRTRHMLSSNEAQISGKMKDYEEKNFNSIVMLYKSAGFQNVTAVPLRDLNLFTQGKNGKVEEVTIDGDSDFDEGDVFPKTAHVTITYHSTK